MFWNNARVAVQVVYLKHDVGTSLIPGGSRLRVFFAAGVGGSALWHFKRGGLVAGRPPKSSARQRAPVYARE